MGFVGGITGGQRNTYNLFIPSFVFSFRGFGGEGGGALHRVWLTWRWGCRRALAAWLEVAGRRSGGRPGHSRSETWWAPAPEYLPTLPVARYLLQHIRVLTDHNLDLDYTRVWGRQPVHDGRNRSEFDTSCIPYISSTTNLRKLFSTPWNAKMALKSGWRSVLDNF